MRRLIFLTAILLLAALTLTSCSHDVDHEYCELGFSLPREYEKCSVEQFDLAFSNGEAFVGVMRLSFEALIEGGILSTYSPELFARIYMDLMGHTDEYEVEVYESVPYFTYTRKDDTGSYFYMATFFKTQYSYFVITYICSEELSGGYRVEFLELATRVYALPEYIE